MFFNFAYTFFQQPIIVVDGELCSTNEGKSYDLY